MGHVRIIFLGLLFFGFLPNSKGQTNHPLAEVIEQVSNQWKQDSNSCKGYRLKVFKDVLKSQIDSTSKEFIFSKFGKPNQIQKFYSGNTKKSYVGYIYFVYKDRCPKIELDGFAIQFVFDESERYLVEISEIEYCG